MGDQVKGVAILVLVVSSAYVFGPTSRGVLRKRSTGFAVSPCSRSHFAAQILPSAAARCLQQLASKGYSQIYVDSLYFARATGLLQKGHIYGLAWTAKGCGGSQRRSPIVVTACWRLDLQGANQMLSALKLQASAEGSGRGLRGVQGD